MAAGALEVVKNNPAYKGILAYGVDGTAEAALLIKYGLLTATSLQSAYDLATKILDTTEKLLTEKQNRSMSILIARLLQKIMSICLLRFTKKPVR
jgi:ABC-type sugar transport system substrate-binding protein